MAGRVMNDKIKLPIGLLNSGFLPKGCVPGLLEESDGNFTRDTCATGKKEGQKTGRSQCYSKYLRLESSSSVRSTTSGGEVQFCWVLTLVHDGVWCEL